MIVVIMGEDHIFDRLVGNFAQCICNVFTGGRLLARVDHDDVVIEDDCAVVTRLIALKQPSAPINLPPLARIINPFVLSGG